MNIKNFDKIVLIVIKDRQVLATLGKGQDNWQLPTTVPGDEATDVETLGFLAKTELGATLRPETVHHFKTFEAHAHSHSENVEKTDKAEVRLKCYIGELTGLPQPMGKLEKAEFIWFSKKHLLLQQYNAILNELQDKGLIE